MGRVLGREEERNSICWADIYLSTQHIHYEFIHWRREFPLYLLGNSRGEGILHYINVNIAYAEDISCWHWVYSLPFIDWCRALKYSLFYRHAVLAWTSLLNNMRHLVNYAQHKSWTIYRPWRLRATATSTTIVLHQFCVFSYKIKMVAISIYRLQIYQKSNRKIKLVVEIFVVEIVRLNVAFQA